MVLVVILPLVDINEVSDLMDLWQGVVLGAGRVL